MRSLLMAAVAAGVTACSAVPPTAPSETPARAVQSEMKVVVPQGSPALTASDLAEIRKTLPARLAADQVRQRLVQQRSVQQAVRRHIPDDLEDFPTVYPDWFYYRFIHRGYPYYWPYNWSGGYWNPWWGGGWW